ncbi:pyridoxamine 5'-phosphate oxidase family protein [Aquimarina sp. TRL1]|uniref:pyridoxamine 5'-phosphate oxidase family protein n=1 Tax=Aquimarina sp. (strain TRL1) TaxID=2736252 RepID=UPI001589FC1C|nr:pyridoxamine 5'-phosphate oxidase family protein [Aquimarina sp. TRL1]QKX06623.1 pyridoxamine 5'-phosphate oxidase family protein [Aquimarina sp. TRL1]
MITTAIKESIEKSVLCWLATASKENIPNVSPKEAFTHYNDDSIIIANIASPQSMQNIKENARVCVSFIDVFVQKGFQIKGTARLIDITDEEFNMAKVPLLEMTKGKFPFTSITLIKVEKVKKIIAPSYILYPDTTEEEQVSSALKTYVPNK